MARRASGVAAREWRERMGRWRRAGLSVSEFCRREGVSEPSFYQWRRRLQPRPAGGEAPAVGEAPRRPVDAQTSRRPGNGEALRFVELPALPSLPAVAGVQVTLPSGAVVALPAHASAELIRTVIRAALSPAGEEPRC